MDLPVPNVSILNKWIQTGATFSEETLSSLKKEFATKPVDDTRTVRWIGAQVPPSWVMKDGTIYCYPAEITDPVTFTQVRWSQKYEFYDSYQYVYFNIVTQSKADREKEAVHNEFNCLMSAYRHSISFTYGCGLRGQPHIDSAYQNLVEFTRLHPEFKDRIPNRAELCRDDGVNGLSGAMMAMGGTGSDCRTQ